MISTELVLVLGIVVSGVGAGLATLRNNINRQLHQVSALPDAVIPTAAEIRRQVAYPVGQGLPVASKAEANAASVSHSWAGVNLVVNVQYPAPQGILPPSP